MLPKSPRQYVDGPIGPPTYLNAAFRQHIFTANSPQIRFANSPLEWPLGNIRILRNHLREVIYGRSLPKSATVCCGQRPQNSSRDRRLRKIKM